MIFKGRNRVRYPYSRYGWTRNNGKTWHGGIDIEGIDDTTILMPTYKNNDGSERTISGTVTRARIVTDKSNKTWEWGYYVCVQLDDNQTPDYVNFMYFCHCKQLLVKVGDKVKSGDKLAIMGNTGNAALANPPYAHVHFEVRKTATSTGLDPTKYCGFANEVGTYGTEPSATEPVTPSEPAQVESTKLIDVSKYQGNIDWAKEPYPAIIRTGYRGWGTGQLMTDEKANTNIANAKANGKLYGFYFFSQAINEAEAKAEADYADKIINGRGKGLPLFFDSEWGNTQHTGRADKISKATRTACAKAFCERAKELGYIPGVYTFTSFVSANLDYTTLCKDYAGWLADYRENYDKTLPRNIHQYTSSGVVDGISGRVDMNNIVNPIKKPTEPVQPSKPTNKTQIITITGVNNIKAMQIYNLCKQLKLTDMGLYKAKYTNAEKTIQTITIGPVSNGDANSIYLLCKQIGVVDAGQYSSKYV